MPDAMATPVVLLTGRPGVVTFLVRPHLRMRGNNGDLEDDMANLLTVEDAAAELGTPVRFVRRLVHERRIRFHKIGKYVRISRDDLTAFIAAGRVEPH